MSCLPTYQNPPLLQQRILLEDALIRGSFEDVSEWFETTTLEFIEHDYALLHMPLAALACSMYAWELAQGILNKVPALVRDSEMFKACLRYAIQTEYSEKGRLVFPWHIEPDFWWSGPHLFDEAPDKWFPGLLTHYDEEKYTFIVGIVSKKASVVFGQTSLSPQILENSLEGTVIKDLKPHSFVEFWEKDSQLRCRVHEPKPWSPEGLPPLCVDFSRHFRRMGMVQGDTFVERCVQGKESPDNIKMHIADWRGSGTDLYLFDYLGMLPHEYAEWLEDSSCLSTILEDRRERWNQT